MTRHWRLAIVAIALFAISIDSRLDARSAGGQTGAATSAAAAAVNASPELVGVLSKEIGATSEQAAGAAGSLFSLAKSRLKPEDFSRVAKAVPGIGALLKAAPAVGGATSTSGALSQLAGSSAGGLASAASAFSKLGLKPELVVKAASVLTSFVTKSGGADVGNLLAGVLK